MPYWKYPCLTCGNCVKNDDEAICCDICDKWVHLECANNLSYDLYQWHCNNIDEEYICDLCSCNDSSVDALALPNDSSFSPDPNSAENSLVAPISNSLSQDDVNESLDSSLNSNDITYISDNECNDSNLRGLDFSMLPNSTVQVPAKYFQSTVHFPVRHYKYPCLVCGGPCCENTQNSICCSVCDEWVHLNCTDLTLEQFYSYTSSENLSKPYYCTNCLYGNSVNASPNMTTNRPNLDSLSDLVMNDAESLSPNSVFSDMSDLTISDYHTIEDLNSSDLISVNDDDVFILHLNAVSLCAKYELLIDMLSDLKEKPSIICVSETRLSDSKISSQINEIDLPGYSFVYDNSATNAGGTAIYISNKLQFIHRKDRPLLKDTLFPVTPAQYASNLVKLG